MKASTRYRVTRVLPIPGEIRVRQGDHVTAEQVVAHTDQPGNIFPVNVSNLISTSPADVPAAMLKRVGDPVQEGEPLARSNGIFGYFRQTCESPVTGTVESISSITGQVILRGEPRPLEVNAFVAGTVVEVLPTEGVVIETPAAFVQGIFGIGGEASGPLRILVSRPDQDLTPELFLPEHAGCIVVGGRRVHGAAVARAIELNVRGIICGGINDFDLKSILGYDLGVAITGSERIGITLIVTEGFGEIAMSQRTFDLLKSHAGDMTSVNGATQIRAGVLRPEIVIPLRESVARNAEVVERAAGGELKVGASVRLIRDPYFGELGTITALPVDPQVLASGSKARVLKVRSATGRELIVPRANVEIVVE